MIVTAALFAAFLVSCQRDQETPLENSTPIDIEPSQLDPLEEIKTSQKAEDVQDCESIEELIEERKAGHESWSVFAVDMETGFAVCGINPRKLVKPASILKTITTAAALDKLGSDFRSKTSVYVPNNSASSVSKIVLYGRGAADLDGAQLKNLAQSVKDAGITSIEGDVIGDESYFKGDPYGDGWTWNELQWYYGAPASALSFEDNYFRLKIVNGKANTPRGVKVNLDLVDAKDKEAIGVRRKPGSNTLNVWGEGESLNSRLAVVDPALLAATIFKEHLEANGIEVTGKAVSKDWTSSEGLLELKEVASVKSQPLVETVRKTNKDSVNLYPELLLRELGKRFGGEAPDPNPKLNKLRGDELAGSAYLKKWLTDKTGRGQRLSIHDGSGLSAYNLITTEAIVRNLLYVTKTDFATEFTDSLPVSGQSGTYKNRLKDLGGKVLAKTGTIKHVNSLAGYIYSGNKRIAFAVIVNNETTRKDSNSTIDSIIKRLAS